MNSEPSRAPGWLLVALALAWLVAVPLGLGAALVAPDPGGDLAARAAKIALLYLPGLLVLSLGAAVLARPLLAAMPRWRPGRLVHGLARPSEEPTPAPLKPASGPTPTPSPALTPTPPHTSPHTPAPQAPTPLLALGPGKSPAYAAFGFAWKSPLPGARPGFIALPPAARLVLGRDPHADIVVGLAEASWHHLELEVGEGGVTVTDLGSTNGTRLGDTRLEPQTPTPLRTGDTLHLAEPVALTLTLEALR